jgi:heptosyltransferase I
VNSEIKSILIIKPSSLGDVVHTLPAVAAIRAANPNAELTWVINPEWTPLLRGNPDVDHVHIFPRGDFRGLSAPASLWPWIAKTRKLRPDVAFDFQGLLRSALIGRLSRPHSFWGMSDGREGSRMFYQHLAQVDRQAHAVDRYLTLAESFGVPAPKPIRFSLPTGDPLPRFDYYPPFVLLHPFARGSRKSLSTSVIEEFCRALHPTRVVIVGKSARRINVPENCVNLANQTTLLQLIWLIRTAGFVISVDSGPMHIAAAVTSQLLAIHTWTNPRRVGPYNSEALVWKNGNITRVKDLNEADAQQKGRALTIKDVARVVELVREFLEPSIMIPGGDQGMLGPVTNPVGT